MRRVASTIFLGAVLLSVTALSLAGGGDVIGTPGMSPSLIQVSAGTDYVCYESGLPIAWGDYDADGFPDLPLYHNNGDGTFSEIPEFRDVLNFGNYHGAAWGDYDDDGWPDLVILPYSQGSTPTLLFHNDGNGALRDVAPALGLNVAGFGETPIWGDYDGDGKIDLFAPYYNSAPPFQSLLYRNNGDGTFTESCASAGVCLTDLPPGFTPEGAQWADWNNDGRLDFYAAGRLFQNDGDGHFTNVSTEVGLPEQFDEGAAFIDYDNDGDLDLWVRTVEGGGKLFRNDGGHFVDVTAEAGIPPGALIWGDSWADVNNDGWMDLLYVQRDSPAMLLLNQGDGTFLPDPAFAALDVRTDASAWGDWDNDGDLDLVTWSGCHRFFRNNLNLSPSFSDSYLRVRVLNSAGHETEHGAAIRLRRVDVPNPYVQTRLVDSGSGYLAQSPYAAHFGVAADGTYEISVAFPSLLGFPLIVDKTTDPRLGSIVPRQLANKEMTIYRSGCALVDQPTRPQITRVSGTNPSCVGDPVTLDAGAGYASYAWSTGETTRTITVSPLVPTTYSVRVPNACAEAIGGYLQKVDPVPTASLGEAQLICSGTSAVLHAILTGRGPWTVTWSDGFVQTAPTSPAVRVVTPQTTTAYTLASVATVACASGAVSGSATVTTVVCLAQVSSGALLADGRSVTTQLPSGGGTYALHVSPDRSYAADLEVLDGQPGSASPLLFLSRSDGATPLATAPLNVFACSAGVPGRLTFVPSAADLTSGPLLLHVVDGGAGGYGLRLRLAETTLFCPRWSINGYSAFVDLQNTSDCSVSGRLTLLDSSGVALTTLPFNLDHGATMKIPVPTGLSAVFGSARLTHDGPPGALAGGIYMVNDAGATANFRWPFQEVRAYGATDGK